MKRKNSQNLFKKAQKIIPGGVNSPVRAFRGVGGDPVFMKSAKGPILTDVDGNHYIDYVGSWGPMILGHAHPKVLKAIEGAAKRGTSFGTPTSAEIDLALEVIKAYPSIEKVRFVSSGTEAVMGAIRVARGFTKKNKIIKFDGCYHGHADSLLVKAGSGAATLGVPDSAGVPAEFTEHTLIATFNDIDSVKKLFEEFSDDIAAVIVEPVVGNMGVILPQDDFLLKLRVLCDEEESLLILDEVMTGFRVAFGGAQDFYGVTPDITTLGKIIGGGLPVGAYGGRGDIMDCVAPVGPVYQAGTLSGNPVAMAAGLSTLQNLKKANPYKKLAKLTQKLAEGIEEAASKNNISVLVPHVGSMFTIFFTGDPITNAQEARGADKNLYAQFFHLMLDQGIYLAPSQFEACFISATHTEKHIQQTIKAANKAFSGLVL
ncbi:MAG: glutamate-1-semialdehyde 2,1-aminomutase [Deltaproteobacteria bacterium]|nr:MAG: glutamate-1-semialdehyde 2,1-aminomutase [Deltaproteobacteria bacterium]